MGNRTSNPGSGPPVALFAKPHAGVIAVALIQRQWQRRGLTEAPRSLSPIISSHSFSSPACPDIPTINHSSQAKVVTPGSGQACTPTPPKQDSITQSCSWRAESTSPLSERHTDFETVGKPLRVAQAKVSTEWS